MSIYVGTIDPVSNERIVTVDGKRILQPRIDLGHTGPFSWGSTPDGGSYQLAMALLSEVVDDATATILCKRFELAFVTSLDAGGFETNTDEIKATIKIIQEIFSDDDRSRHLGWGSGDVEWIES